MQIQKVNNTNQKINFGMNVTTALEHFGEPHAKIVAEVTNILKSAEPMGRGVNIETRIFHKGFSNNLRRAPKKDSFVLAFLPEGYQAEAPFVCGFSASDSSKKVVKKMNDVVGFLKKYFENH